jgi:hypothetical protein
LDCVVVNDFSAKPSVTSIFSASSTPVSGVHLPFL